MENQVKPFNVGITNSSYQGYPIMQNQANALQVRDEILSAEIANLQQSMLANNHYMKRYMDSVDKRLTNATKKKHRVRVQQFMCIDSNGNICLRVMFDDGTSETVPFILNCKGHWEVYRLKFRKTEQEAEYFAIVFSQSFQWVVGKMCQNSGKRLYEIFVRAGIKFNEQLSAVRIQEALFLQFGPEIENTECDMFIVENAGWNNGIFVSADKYPYLKRQDFPKLPILKKQFVESRGSENDYQRYFQALRAVQDWRNRVILAIYPLAGILSSILAEERAKIPFYLNFVMVDELDLELIPAFMQVFNREVLAPFHLDESEKKFLQILHEANDEVLIFEALMSQGDVDYRHKKINLNSKMIARIALGKYGIHEGCKQGINVALAVVSDSIQIGTAVKNIFIDKNFVTDPSVCIELLSGNTMSSILTEFVRFVELHMDEVRSIIRRSRGKGCAESEFWTSMLEILEKFWQIAGLNVYEMAMLPALIDVEELCELDDYKYEDLTALFVHIVRGEMYHYCATEKRNAGYMDTKQIYFDDQFLWFIPETLEEMLHHKGAHIHKNAMLLELRKAGILKTDAEGFTRKLQINGRRCETYQVCREVFDIPGTADVIDLAGEVQ